MKCQLVLIAAIAAMHGSACTGDDDDDDHGDHDHDAAAVDPEEEVRCPDDLPELFAGETSGSEATGVKSLINARVIAASPLPPVKLIKNSWTIDLVDADGVAVEDAQIVDACAFMPVHGHGRLAEVTALDEPGRFELGLNFVMRGPWEVQLAVDADSLPDETARAPSCRNAKAGADYLVFEICVKDE